MAIAPEIRMKVEAELRLGKKPKDLVDKYNLPYITIQSWRKKLTSENADIEIDALIETDEITLHMMAEEIKKQPMPIKELKKVNKLVEDINGLKRIEEKSRSLSMKILDGVEAYMDEQAMKDEVVDLKTLREAAGIVSVLHTALFSKNTTNVNVLNNNTVSGEKREIFKSSLRS